MSEPVEVVCGPIAHGGHVVARHEGRVVFVRHALPGERVAVRLTESGESDRFWRGDAVSVIEPSPYRVVPPCPLAGECGGCDFQHVQLAEQRRLKATVVLEQLSRLAGLGPATELGGTRARLGDLEVEAVPGDEDGLRWRTRMQYVALPDGRRGLRRHRSHDVVPVEDCLIAHPDAREVLLDQNRRAPWTNVRTTQVLDGRSFIVEGDGFWQVHPGAPRVLRDAVLTAADPRPGEHALDLYAGVGLFSAFLAESVGPTGTVLSVEGDRRASALAAENLADLPQVKVVRNDVTRIVARYRGPAPDIVVLDPPRAGAKREVMDAVAALRPRAVVYVACDPAALARDTSYLLADDYQLAALRAFDCFPMTHHVECVALFT